ncbi:GtrA family protein [Lactobacillus intestinalis]|uniref:GtrA/DPMS transmembrane domain-containing protein n=1 Tax=Lactobacillus intestinalis DSM 6629 TaxID=1423761 RepID=A0ABR5PPF4_9LACO|nr:GtrA family protein [Lactobacillus intestinalis]KRM32339.1 hypothetical protein FC44_GL001759 [Lactobacillus intestinalis DSM 6629]UTW39882.1 GtrA family protein [Lactobacillus intestinalis]
MQGKVLAIIKSEDFIQLIRYGLIGILGLIVDFGIYSTLTLMTEMRVELANLISSSCGLINNFLWNSYANFKVHDHLIKRFVEYYIVGQITTIFTTICLFIFVSLLRQDKLLVKAISTIIATLIQFGINKAITFKKG